MQIITHVTSLTRVWARTRVITRVSWRRLLLCEKPFEKNEKPIGTGIDYP